MSGRHRVQRHRPARMALVVSAWLIWRSLRPACKPVGEAWSRLVETLKQRFKNTDPFAGVAFAASTTSPDPVAALPAPVEDEQETELGPLTPEQAFRAIHDRNPHLPASHVRWHFFDGAVAGEVYALDASEDGQREIVKQYAGVFSAAMSEHADGPHLIVAVVGEFANVAFTVAAVLLHDDTMPLPVFDEAAADPTVGDDTLTTQHIPERVLAEVVGAR